MPLLELSRGILRFNKNGGSKPPPYITKYLLPHQGILSHGQAIPELLFR